MKKILLSGLVALGLFAMGCSNDDVIDNGSNPDAKYDTYLQLSISSPSINTRTTGPTDPGVEGTESKISSVHVYLLNADKTVAASYAETGMAGIKTKAFAVPTGTYNLVVVANPTATNIDDLGAVNAAFNFDELIKNVTNADAASGYKSGAFLMTTAFNDVDRIAPTATISSTDTKEKPAEATAKVDRVAVKIVDKV